MCSSTADVLADVLERALERTQPDRAPGARDVRHEVDPHRGCGAAELTSSPSFDLGRELDEHLRVLRVVELRHREVAAALQAAIGQVDVARVRAGLLPDGRLALQRVEFMSPFSEPTTMIGKFA